MPGDTRAGSVSVRRERALAAGVSFQWPSSDARGAAGVAPQAPCAGEGAVQVSEKWRLCRDGTASSSSSAETSSSWRSEESRFLFGGSTCGLVLPIGTALLDSARAERRSASE